MGDIWQGGKGGAEGEGEARPGALGQASGGGVQVQETSAGDPGAEKSLMLVEVKCSDRPQTPISISQPAESFQDCPTF